MVPLEFQVMVTARCTRSLPLNTTLKDQIEPVCPILQISVSFNDNSIRHTVRHSVQEVTIQVFTWWQQLWRYLNSNNHAL